MNGMWGPWGEGACSESDCEGTMNKARACNNPAPANGGTACDDSTTGATTTAPCNQALGECPGLFMMINT